MKLSDEDLQDMLPDPRYPYAIYDVPTDDLSSLVVELVELRAAHITQSAAKKMQQQEAQIAALSAEVARLIGFIEGASWVAFPHDADPAAQLQYVRDRLAEEVSRARAAAIRATTTQEKPKP